MKSIDIFGDYVLFNNGMIFSKHRNKFLKPFSSKNENRTVFYSLRINKKNKVLRLIKLLKDNFELSDIKYDVNDPPIHVFMQRINDMNMGVYKTSFNKKGSNLKPFRVVIQHKNKHYASYYKTQEDAQLGWIINYSVLHDYDLDLVLNMVGDK